MENMENFVVKFSNGVCVFNTTPHPLNFLDGEENIVVPCSGVLINAKAENDETPEGCVTFCEPTFVGEEESELKLQELEKALPGVLIIGSVIAAQAYPGRVAAMIASPGFERKPPAEKRMSVSRFTKFKPKP